MKLKSNTDGRRIGMSGGWHAVGFILPLALYLAIGALEPRFHSSQAGTIESSQVLDADAVQANDAAQLSTRTYVALTLAKFLLVGGCLVVFFPSYLGSFSWNVDGRGWVIGIIGFVLWIGCCSLAIETQLLAWLGIDGINDLARSQFDPGEQIQSGWWRIPFFAARLGLLMLVVPLAEEIFLRGFLMRMIQSNDWTRVDIKRLGWPALACGSLYGVATHPNEMLAALVWFSLISWLMVRSGKFWNCVIAHATTNGLLGIYIVLFGQWQLW